MTLFVPSVEVTNGDAVRQKIAARQRVRGHRRREIGLLPDDAAGKRVGCVNVIRFRHRDDHCASARTALDVKRLRVNVADDGAVEIGITRERRGVGGRERRINVKPVA